MVSKIISRDDYLNKLIAFKDKQLIKVITGIRRCGKSTIMEIYQDYLQKEMKVTNEQIIAINLEDYDFYDMRDPKKLYAYIKERLLPDQMNYIFLDEIQQCEDFPRVVDSLYIKNNVDLYVTGSNANMLSSEIATLLSGRYVEIKMLPLSFKEYVESTGDEDDLQRKYTTYLENSSFPYALELAGHPKEIRDYLDGIYNTIKDFLTEYNDLINEMDKLYNADSARKYDMLTNDEKDSMTDDEVEQWEDKIKSALLRKDNSLYNVMNTLTTTMMDGYYENNLSDKQKKNMSASEISAWYKENGGKKHYLSDYGIGTLSYFEAQDNEHHAYHINGDADDEFTSTKEDKLKAAIADDPEGTANFFATLCKTLYSKLDETMSESTEYSSIYKVYNDKQLKKDYKDYTTKISDAEDELNDYEDRWYNKFSKMEVALSKLQSQTSSISSMLGSN